MELKIDKKFIDDAVQSAVADIKQNYVPMSVIKDIMKEIDEQCDCVKRDNIYCSEGLEMALNIIDKYIDQTGAEWSDKE